MKLYTIHNSINFSIISSRHRLLSNSQFNCTTSPNTTYRKFKPENFGNKSLAETETSHKRDIIDNPSHLLTPFNGRYIHTLYLQHVSSLMHSTSARRRKYADKKTRMHLIAPINLERITVARNLCAMQTRARARTFPSARFGRESAAAAAGFPAAISYLSNVNAMIKYLQ